MSSSNETPTYNGDYTDPNKLTEKQIKELADLSHPVKTVAMVMKEMITGLYEESKRGPRTE